MSRPSLLTRAGEAELLATSGITLLADAPETGAAPTCNRSLFPVHGESAPHAFAPAPGSGADSPAWTRARQEGTT